MDAFLKVHADDVVGKIETFDRMIFKGHLTRFFPEGAFTRFLHSQGVLLKGFSAYVQKATAASRSSPRATRSTR